MGTLKQVTDSLDELKTFVQEVDNAVELLHQQIKDLTNDGITPEAADVLLMKVADVRAAVGKVATDDNGQEQPTEAEPVPTPEAEPTS